MTTKTTQSPPLSEWPEWANWFAIDKDKTGYFYGQKPEATNDIEWVYEYEDFATGNCDFNPIGWQNSLISRAELEALEAANTETNTAKSYVFISSLGNIVASVQLDSAQNALAFADSLPFDDVRVYLEVVR